MKKTCVPIKLLLDRFTNSYTDAIKIQRPGNSMVKDKDAFTTDESIVFQTFKVLTQQSCQTHPSHVKDFIFIKSWHFSIVVMLPYACSSSCMHVSNPRHPTI